MWRTPPRDLASGLALFLLLVLLGLACARNEQVPSTLVDGTPAGPSPVRLEGVDLPTVLTRVRVIGATRVRSDSRVGSCFAQDWDEAPRGQVVRRVGVYGESVTFRNTSRSGLHACDDGAGAREGERPWCGHVLGRLVEGSLRDPRLDLGACSAADDGPLAFAWVTPEPRTEFVVVHHDGFAEAYRVAADLPVRVATTSRIDTIGSSATFELSEHASGGQRLRAFALETRVAG